MMTQKKHHRILVRTHTVVRLFYSVRLIAKTKAQHILVGELLQMMQILFDTAKLTFSHAWAILLLVTLLIIWSSATKNVVMHQMTCTNTSQADAIVNWTRLEEIRQLMLP